jgi:hypothetical protein
MVAVRGYMICADKRMGVPLSTTVDNIVYRMGALNSAEAVHVYVQAEYELGCKWGDPA